MKKNSPPTFNSFAEFWPFYVREHLNVVSRSLHVVGTLLAVALGVFFVQNEMWERLWLLPVVGYGFAWTGHFAFEKNKPATFRYPLWSFCGDWKMIFKVLTRGMRAEIERAVKDGRRVNK